MTKINDLLYLLEQSDLHWDFEGKYPYYTFKINDKGYYVNESVDPFPCYCHDIRTVRLEIDRINIITCLPHIPVYYIFSHENISRCNGHTSENSYYDDKDKFIINPYITLYGKRIPIHQVWTKYLVSYEFGHCIQYNLKKLLDIERDKFKKDYAEKIRKIAHYKEYGGLRWHKNTMEIIANDIRIVLFGSEPDYWPREIEHPIKCKEVIDYWNDINNKFFKQKIQESII